MRRSAERWMRLLIVAAILQGGVSTASAQVVLKFGHFAPETHPAHVAAKEFAARVEERTKGQVKIAISPNTPPEQLEPVKGGAFDMVLTTPAALEKHDKTFGVVMLPFVFDDAAHAHRVLDGPGLAWLGPLAERYGLVILANWEGGFRHLTTGKRPIVKPDDVKGLKIRAAPDAPIEAAMEALGAIPTKIALPELYRSLARAVVDGQESPIADIVQNRINEVQRHLALTRHTYTTAMHVITFVTLTRLRSEHQRIVREESLAAGELMRRLVAKEEAEQIGKLQHAGMTVTRPDVAGFRALMGPAYKRLSEAVGERNVELLLMFAENARKK